VTADTPVRAEGMDKWARISECHAFFGIERGLVGGGGGDGDARALQQPLEKRLARVVHRFDGTEPSDLTLIPGHVIVLEKTPVGKNWWRG
jgi:hypothetical protein